MLRPVLRYGPELGQVVAAGAEVVVDDVQQHGQAAAVAGVDEPLQRVRAAVGLVHRVPGHPVIAPVPDAVDRVHRQQLDVGDAQLDQVIQPLDRRVQRGARGERADVQFVDHRARPAPGRPSPVVPLVGGVVIDLGQAVHAVGQPLASAGRAAGWSLSSSR